MTLTKLAQRQAKRRDAEWPTLQCLSESGTIRVHWKRFVSYSCTLMGDEPGLRRQRLLVNGLHIMDVVCWSCGFLFRN